MATPTSKPYNILTVSNEDTARLFAVGRSFPLCYCDRTSSAPSNTSPSGQIPTSPTGWSKVRKRPRASLHPDGRRMPHIRAGRNSLPERPRPLRQPRAWRRERAFYFVLKNSEQSGHVIVPATTDTVGLVREVIPIAKSASAFALRNWLLTNEFILRPQKPSIRRIGMEHLRYPNESTEY